MSIPGIDGKMLFSKKSWGKNTAMEGGVEDGG
jgi:hypothetical protein